MQPGAFVLTNTTCTVLGSSDAVVVLVEPGDRKFVAGLSRKLLKMKSMHMLYLDGATTEALICTY